MSESPCTEDKLFCPEGKKIYRPISGRRISYIDLFYGAESEELNRILENNSKGSNREKLDKLLKILKMIMKNELTPLQRECIELRYFNQLYIHEIAKQKGISEQAVSACISRAQNRIKKIMKYYI